MKYKLTKETKEVYGITLYRIEATKAFGDVSKGDKGGWIEKEGNLSQEGNAWVYDDAQVFGDAQVYDNAQVYGDAQLIGGCLYHTNTKSEQIERVQTTTDSNYETLASNPQFAPVEIESLVGQEAIVEIGGKKYKAVIKEEN